MFSTGAGFLLVSACLFPYKLYLKMACTGFGQLAIMQHKIYAGVLSRHMIKLAHIVTVNPEAEMRNHDFI